MGGGEGRSRLASQPLLPQGGASSSWRNPCSVSWFAFLLTYLYSDEPLAVWDHRIAHASQKQLEQLKAKPARADQERGADSRLHPGPPCPVRRQRQASPLSLGSRWR
ncbi:hypothetical protein C8Q76DRAFT_713329 [Earliella scabrosa]|nr:hypothetical protein C8Q76DRAFT_713329 [Earliella scabrosa]